MLSARLGKRVRQSGIVMAVRAYWSGRIRLALVSIPVDIVPATKSSGRISFHQIHEPSGKRIRYERSCPASVRWTPTTS